MAEALSNEPATEATPTFGARLLKQIMFFVAALVSVASYGGLTATAHLQHVYAGFVFALVWGGFHHAALKEIPQILCGALLGITLAYLFQTIPGIYPHYGSAGVEVFALACVYCLLAGWFKFVINNAAMLFLIIGTIPAVQAKESFPQMGMAVIIAALYFGALAYGMACGQNFMARRQRDKVAAHALP